MSNFSPRFHAAKAPLHKEKPPHCRLGMGGDPQGNPPNCAYPGEHPSQPPLARWQEFRFAIRMGQIAHNKGGCRFRQPPYCFGAVMLWEDQDFFLLAESTTTVPADKTATTTHTETIMLSPVWGDWGFSPGTGLDAPLDPTVKSAPRSLL